MGGSGGSGGSGGDAGTLGLVQTVPADLATDVPTDVAVTAEFDVELNAATVTTGSFSLRRDGGAEVEGSVAVLGQTASYTPARPLGLLSRYTATLATAIEGISGQTLEVSHSWGFRTRDGQWGDPALLIETDDAGDAHSPHVAFDPNGNAFAFWIQSDGTRDNIWTKRFTWVAGWGEAELFETHARPLVDFQVAFGPDGNAVVLWHEPFNFPFASSIWSNRYTPSGGWEAARLLGAEAVFLQVAFDPNGNGFAVWARYWGAGVRYDIMASRFTQSGGWGTAELIETDNTGFASSPRVAVGPNGNAVAVWTQRDGTRINIWTNRFE